MQFMVNKYTLKEKLFFNEYQSDNWAILRKKSLLNPVRDKDVLIELATWATIL